MNRVLLYSIFALMMLSFVSCSNEDEVQSTGWLVLGDVSAQQVEGVTVTTRAVDSDLIIEIIDAQGVVTTLDHASASGKIALEAGEYTLHAYNDVLPDEGAHYDGSTTFTVQPEKTSYVSLSVPMTNVAVSLSLPEGYEAWFTDYTFTLSYNGSDLTVDNGGTVYLALPITQDVKTASYTITVTNTDGEQMTQDGTFVMEPGHHYTVTYQLGS